MRIVSVSLHGCKVGTAPSKFNSEPPLRGSVSGWSAASTRRNVDFLRSVEYHSISDMGVCFTGTLKDCPPTSDDWHAIRNAFIRRLRRMGMIRSHWVTEWQRRGVPHLHGMFFFPAEMCSVDVRIRLVNHWLDVARAYNPSRAAQYTTMMFDGLGWAQYSAKHAARGVSHYQRSPENIPAEWKLKTGRVWGKTGDWPTRDAMRFDVSDSVYFSYRRLLRRWRISDARASGDSRRIRAARRCLQSSNRRLSNVRGANEWVDIDTATAMLFAAVTISNDDGSIEQIE